MSKITPELIKNAIEDEINMRGIYNYQGAKLATGFGDIDIALKGGLNRGGAYIIKSREETSEFAIRLANNVGIKNGGGVVYFCLKDAAREVMRRSVELLAGISPLGERLTKEEYLKAVNDAIPLYDGKNMYIEQGMENGYYSMKDIIDRCKKIEDDIDIIIIDEIRELAEYHTDGTEGIDSIAKAFESISSDRGCAVVGMLEEKRYLCDNKARYIDERFDNVWSYRKNNDENSAGNQYKLVVGKGPANDRMTVFFRM